MFNRKLVNSFLFFSVISSTLKTYDLPVFKWGYSASAVFEKYKVLWESVPKTTSVSVAQLLKLELSAFKNLVVQDVIEGCVSPLCTVSSNTFSFDVQSRLINIVKEIDALFNSQAALASKSCAKRTADFIGTIAQLAAQRGESTEVFCKQKYSLLKSITKNVVDGIDRGSSSDYQIKSFNQQIDSQSIMGFNQWLERRGRPFGESYSTSSQSFSQADIEPEFVQDLFSQQEVQAKAHLRELTGFRDQNHICPICKDSFDKGVMVTPFACKSKLHLFHPRCVSGKMRCPEAGCGASVGKCSSVQQVDCVICMEPLFGQHTEVTAIFKCSQGRHKGRSHLLHQACARELLKNKADATCPECRAENINMF